MFKKILIANRGEIACRVIKSAKKMGILTVAVYSDADRNALHVKMADEAVHIGASTASESYLVQDKILEACRQTGAEAVHPGYGFLSENASFCKKLADAGIAFIGPPEGAIIAMGDKIESKRVAIKAGVSTVPGFDGILKDADEAVKISDEIGYPVMLKASAGGGGKGMRIAWNSEEAHEGFIRAQSEARNSFGDDRVFVEKFITRPRHIEIQILADQYGNCLYLGERECSIQRRNQKVLEEAPSAFLDEETRNAMGAQSVALAKAVGYHSAGTVEFIVDEERNFYFLEMNTRLQVEHPVTELITGIDLVEAMIRVAAGEKLPMTQTDIKLSGWAIESRVYAEDPYRGFLPSIGRLSRYQPPAETSANGQTIRNDTGVYEGAEISMFYDPMIAKLCTHAATRGEAISLMSDALDRFEIDGISHNIGFLSDIMQEDDWKAGAITTGYIAEKYPDGVPPRAPQEDDLAALAAIALSAELRRKAKFDAMSGRVRAHSGHVPTEWTVFIGSEQIEITNLKAANEATSLNYHIGNVEHTLAVMSASSATLWQGKFNGQPIFGQITHKAGCMTIKRRGMSVEARVMRPNIAKLYPLMPIKDHASNAKQLISDMPGLVVSIAVNVGDRVTAGQTLAIVEAMKMENVLTAQRDGVVSKVHFANGQNLAVDDVIMEFE